MQRTAIFGGNWKMNHTLEETERYLQDFINYDFPAHCDVVLFVPFTSLHLMQKYLKGTKIAYGAQNFYYEKSGAFTGEISLSMLKSLGCTHVLTGHSERRAVFQESDEIVRLKTVAALDAGVTPMVCVGESLDQRKRGETARVIETQVKAVLQSMSQERIAKLLFAYEPIWAIGTGVNASIEDAKDGIDVVRNAIAVASTPQLADTIRIVYGGSVKTENISGYMQNPTVDGGLVGGASLKASDFFKLIVNGASNR